MPTPLGIALTTLTTQLNQLIETTFPDECSISRPTLTVNAYGSAPPSYATVASSIGCSWAPSGKTGMEYTRASQTNEVVPYMVTLPSVVNGAATDIKPKDRIVVVARGQEPIRTFEVKAILRNAGLPLSVLCTLEEQ